MTYLSRIQIFIKIRVRIIEKFAGSRFEKDETPPGYDASKTSQCSNFWWKIARNLAIRFEKNLGRPLEMSCLRRTEILVEIVLQSYKKSWSEVLGTKWQTCIQNLPGPKQRFLVISQNWCGDFPPNLVITLNLLCLPQIQIFIEILLSLVKKSIDPLFWTLGSSGFVQNLSLFGFLMKDNSIPDLPIWIKLGSAGENIRLERHTNFGGKRFSKFHEIMVRSGWYQMTNVHPKSAWP